jgi:hypothetical protein
MLMSNSEADEYRRRAAECRELAAKSHVPAHKERWLKIAEKWMRMADYAAGRPIRHEPGGLGISANV